MFSSFRFLRYLFLRAFPRNFVIGRDAAEDAEENDDDDGNDNDNDDEDEDENADAENVPSLYICKCVASICMCSSFFPRVASREPEN